MPGIMKHIFNAFLLITLLGANAAHAHDKPDCPGYACTLSGPGTVVIGNTETYNLPMSDIVVATKSADGAAAQPAVTSCTANSWTTTCGVITSFTSTSVTVYFNTTACTKAVITGLNAGVAVASTTVTLTLPPALVGGTISTGNQTINSGATPGGISASIASGGGCGGAYTYQWYANANGAGYQPISGATNQNYQPGPLTVTTSYERLAKCLNVTAYTSNTTTVTVWAPLVVGTLTANQQIGSNTAPVALNLGAVSGGNGVYTYNWQSSTNSSFTSPTTVSTLPGPYQPPALTATTYYRCIVTSNGVPVTSNTVTITVYSISPGTLGSSQIINYNTVPAALSLVGSGSNGTGVTLTYAWFYSINGGQTWTPLTVNGVAVNGTTFSPAALIQTTEYEVVVSGGVSVTSNIVTITVYGQLVSGAITPTPQTIPYNTVPSALSIANPTGGSGTNSFQWYVTNTNGGTYTPIANATGTSYAPGALTANTYYEVITTSNGVPVTSKVAVINVQPRVISPYSSSMPLNYIREWDGLVPDQSATDLVTHPVKDVRQTTTYFDGLGRLLQTVIKGVTPAGNDMVSPNYYDPATGRELNHYLPFSSNTATTGDVTNDGNIKMDPFLQQSAFYSSTPILANQGEQFFYSQTVYELSPLNRVQTNYAPGNNWVGNSVASQEQYMNNTAADNVQIWTLTASFASVPNTTAPVPVNGGPYAPGTLYKTINIDESGNQTVVFTDNEGRVILKQVQGAATPGTNHAGWLNTYYIYDNLDNIRYVLQPDAVQLLLNANTWNLSSIPNLLTGLCFYYEYDQRNRVILKQVPGVSPVYMVYDNLDRMVMTQDGNLRAAGQWQVTVFENNLDRPVQTGLLTDGTAFGTELANAYVSTSYPSTAANYQQSTQTYYDNYTWQSGTPLSGGFDGSQSSAAGFMAASNSSYPYAQSVTQTPYTTMGMVTGKQSRVLGTSNYLYATNYYDDHDRVIQTQSTNITGGTDETTTQYAFDGKELVTQTKDVKNGSNVQTNTVQSQFTYDAAGRMTGTTKSFSGAVGTVTKVLANKVYNELGELQTKILGPTSGLNEGPVDQLTYDYNIRGWLLGINRNYLNSGTSIAITNAPPTPGNYFGEELAYDNLNSMSGMSYTVAQLNGNMAGSVWKSSGDAVPRKYDYVYDNANRLLAANFTQITPTNAQALNFAATMSYDANGNITAMTQNGYQLGKPAINPIDNLTYTYFPASNQLKNVVDGANNTQTILGDFRSSQAYMNSLGGIKTGSATDYAYDPDGNLVVDQNKDMGIITSTSQTNGISYNFLSLPQLVTLNGNKGTVQFIYDADGNKLQKITTENSGSVTYNGTSYTGVAITTTTTYIGEFVYQSVSYPNNTVLNASTLQHGDILQFASHEEGRIRLLYYNTTSSNIPTGYAFDYFIKDHLGNTRMVLTDEQYTAPPYEATMEPANAAAEEQVFANIASTQTAKPGGFDNNANNQYVALTNYTTNKIGPSLVLKVMAGDQLSISVQAYYLASSGTTDNAGTLAATDLLTSLLGGITGVGGERATLTDLQNNSSVLNTASQSFLNSRSAPTPGVPQAYLNYVFLDDQFQYAGGYASPITSAMATSAQPLQANPIPVAAPKNGYVYVFVSNESNYNVYFDNLLVVYQQGPIQEDNAYYPYGLTMAGISDKAVKTNYAENKYRYNDGNELQNKEFSDGSGLETYDASFRMYDAQIGRFWQIDPLGELAEDFSSYSFAYDNPVSLHDPLGLAADDSANVVPDRRMHPVCIKCTLPKPDVAKAAGPAPTSVAPPIDPKSLPVPWMNDIGVDIGNTHGVSEDDDPTYSLASAALTYARSEDTDPTTCPWCAAYGSYTIHNTGFQQPRSPSSAQWLTSKTLKKTGPYYGAIGIFQDYKDPQLKHRTGSGHITFLYGFTRGGSYIFVGGNQGDRLKFSTYPRTSNYIKSIHGYMHLEGFYFPIDYNGPRVIAPLYQSDIILNKLMNINSSSNTTR
jgi:RHS repeat-associated protein